MLTVQSRKNAGDTKDYFRHEERLEGKEARPPQWFGLGALRLGLQGLADRLVFNRLVDNKLPSGKGKITPRRGENSIVLQEFVFNAPKSVSLAAEFAPHGEKVREAFVASVLESMGEAVEPGAATRVRVKGAMDDRKTGEITGTLFVHSTNREQEPHLHAHATVQNHTWDSAEGKFKALKVHDIYKSIPDIQRDFHRRLRQKVERLGYQTERKGKFWEISGVSKSTLRKFSSRRNAIERLYDAVAKVTPGLRRKAGLMTRDKKPQVTDLGKLKEDWVSLLTPREIKDFRSLAAKPKTGRGLERNKSRVAQLRQLSYDIAAPTKDRSRG